MNLSEVRTEKTLCEKRIDAALKQFTDATGLYIDGLTYNALDTTTIGDDGKSFDYQTLIKVVL